MDFYSFYTCKDYVSIELNLINLYYYCNYISSYLAVKSNYGKVMFILYVIH